MPLNLELKLEVWDSPNSAGVVIDAIRCARLGLDRHLGGALDGPSAYFMKSPPVQYRDDVARQLVESFITADAATAASALVAPGQNENNGRNGHGHGAEAGQQVRPASVGA